MEQPVSTESSYPVKVSDIVMLMYGAPLDISRDSSRDQMTLNLNPDFEHTAYTPPRFMRAGHATVSCVIEHDGVETDHAMACASIPSNAKSWLRGRFAPAGEINDDPTVWLHVESWPAEYAKRLKLFAAEEL